MSLSRKRVRALRSAGWTVIEEGPLVELRAGLRSLLRRRRPCRVEPAGLVVHMPAPRGWSR